MTVEDTLNDLPTTEPVVSAPVVAKASIPAMPPFKDENDLGADLDEAATGSDAAAGFEEEYEDGGEDELCSVEEAVMMLDRGEKHLMDKDYELASDELSRAVSALSAHYGDGAAECADALYLYGRALYNLAVEKSSVFGGGNAAQDADQMSSEAVKLLAEKAARIIFSGDGDDLPDAEEGSAEADDGTDDLEIAYESLCVAATAYQKQMDNEASRKRLSDVYLLLGHYHLEGDRPQEASEEYKKGIEVREQHSIEGHREMAELRYYYTLTLESTGRYKEALAQTELAMKDVSARIAILEKLKAAEESTKGKGPAPERPVDAVGEIRELQEMLKDLEGKIEEVTSKMSAVDTVLQKTFVGGDTDGDVSKTEVLLTKKEEKPVMDVSNLMKKRKAPEPVTAPSETDTSKKTKIEEKPSSQ
ncbi:hypothetical protein DFS34DRAFT_421167 [Phlyctochytrium arcticum]|nr:hypothetical protein DFS34DRAFT_421167 [Phlyctochytrium arcticum]